MVSIPPVIIIIIMISFAPISSKIKLRGATIKTKGLGKLVITKTMRESSLDGRRSKEAKVDRQHYRGRFLDVGGMKVYYLLI